MRCTTKYIEHAIENNEALNLFAILKDTIDWEDGIPSKKHGFTRKAKAISVNQYPLILQAVIDVLTKMGNTNYMISHIYLNYYENGDMFTPNHSHQGTHQLVISLGGQRKLNVAKKTYVMNNGDAILFGSSIHGVPKEEYAEPRISIATFMFPV